MSHHSFLYGEDDMNMPKDENIFRQNVPKHKEYNYGYNEPNFSQYQQNHAPYQSQSITSMQNQQNIYPSLPHQAVALVVQHPQQNITQSIEHHTPSQHQTYSMPQIVPQHKQVPFLQSHLPPPPTPAQASQAPPLAPSQQYGQWPQQFQVPITSHGNGSNVSYMQQPYPPNSQSQSTAANSVQNSSTYFNQPRMQQVHQSQPSSNSSYPNQSYRFQQPSQQPSFGYPSNSSSGTSSSSMGSLNSLGYLPPSYSSSSTSLKSDPDSVMQSYYKPTRTKRNSRPRINKILDGNTKPASTSNSNISTSISKSSSVENKRIDLTSTSLWGVLGEVAIDEIRVSFANAMNIKEPYSSSSDKNVPKLKLSNPLEYRLFDIFIHMSSKAMDHYLGQNIFQEIVAELALYDETEMLINSIICLCGSILNKGDPSSLSKDVPTSHYQRALSSIRHHLSESSGEDPLDLDGAALKEYIKRRDGLINRCLVSTIILCLYEFENNKTECTHIKGATSILTTILIRHREGTEQSSFGESNSSSSSLLSTSYFHSICFWSIFQLDILISIRYGVATMYSYSDYWKRYDKLYFESFERIPYRSLSPVHDYFNRDTANWWMQRAFIDFSLINDFKNSRDTMKQDPNIGIDLFTSWHKLKKSVDEYESNLPLNLKPTIYQPCSPSRHFPVIYFKDEKTAITTIIYKVSRILLYESLVLNADKSELMRQELAKFSPGYIQKVIKDACGIIKTYGNDFTLWPIGTNIVDDFRNYFKAEPECAKQFEHILAQVRAAERRQYWRVTEEAKES
ncbi:hypothetical protein CLIB1423_04S06700 [[Candida] railenensis]|uniref:Uncharacterized protein n=1 Tax=[Candida] railenensis TaxID=45579 RepID=A0A9P0QM76_9ASCO|nr:hypothetical protein CLIB1423_04S06700 [[Candida] railenensis]